MNLFESLNKYKEANNVITEKTGVYTDEDLEKAGYIYNKREQFWYYKQSYTKGTDEYKLIYDDNSGTFIVYNDTLYNKSKQQQSGNIAQWSYKEVDAYEAVKKFKKLFNVKESASPNGKKEVYVEEENGCYLIYDAKTNKEIFRAIKAGNPPIENLLQMFGFKKVEKPKKNKKNESLHRMNEGFLEDTINKIKTYLQQRRDDKNIRNILNRIQSNYKGDSEEDKLHAFFKELVPESGKADTVAGEIIRAMMRLQYRWFNDGDYFFDGYGLETCGAAAAYLDEQSKEIDYVITDIISDANLEAEEDYEKIYQRQLNHLTNVVIDYIIQNPNLLVTPNDVDMHDTDYNWIKEAAPKYDLDFNLGYELGWHVEQGHTTIGDIIEDLSCDSPYNNYEIESYYGDALIIRDMSWEDFEYARDDIDRWLEQESEMLDEEYGSEEDYDEDEEDYDEDEDWE